MEFKEDTTNMCLVNLKKENRLSEQPYFSIVIPAKGRPGYLHQAIMSVLLQDFDNFELIISNNGGDQILRDTVRKFDQDHRLKYLEQENILNMPVHWEKISHNLKGEYFLVLTDRSLFRQGALASLHSAISEINDDPEVISWPWDIYLDHVGVFSAYPNPSWDIKQMNPINSLMESINDNSFCPYLLPRALNSCVRVDFMESLRTQYDQIFRPITPDFTFACLCLLNSERFYYINHPLFVSQGMKVSNGGNSYSGDANGYLSTLDLEIPFMHVPVKLPLVQNMVHEDFLAMLLLSGRQDLVKTWDRVNYIVKCAFEIEEKRKHGTLPVQMIIKMEKEFDAFLAKESLEIRMGLNFRNSHTHKIRLKILEGVKNIVTRRMEWFYKALLLREAGNQYYPTALEAAGFEVTVKS